MTGFMDAANDTKKSLNSISQSLQSLQNAVAKVPISDTQSPYSTSTITTEQSKTLIEKLELLKNTTRQCDLEMSNQVQKILSPTGQNISLPYSAFHHMPKKVMTQTLKDFVCFNRHNGANKLDELLETMCNYSKDFTKIKTIINQTKALLFEVSLINVSLFTESLSILKKFTLLQRIPEMIHFPNEVHPSTFQAPKNIFPKLSNLLNSTRHFFGNTAWLVKACIFSIFPPVDQDERHKLSAEIINEIELWILTEDRKIQIEKATEIMQNLARTVPPLIDIEQLTIIGEEELTPSGLYLDRNQFNKRMLLLSKNSLSIKEKSRQTIEQLQLKLPQSIEDEQNELERHYAQILKDLSLSLDYPSLHTKKSNLQNLLDSEKETGIQRAQKSIDGIQKLLTAEEKSLKSPAESSNKATQIAHNMRILRTKIEDEKTLIGKYEKQQTESQKKILKQIETMDSLIEASERMFEEVHEQKKQDQTLIEYAKRIGRRCGGS